MNQVAGGFVAVGASIIGAVGTFGSSPGNDNGVKFSPGAVQIMDKMRWVCAKISAEEFLNNLTLTVTRFDPTYGYLSVLGWQQVGEPDGTRDYFDAVTPADLAIASFWEALACDSKQTIDAMKIYFNLCPSYCIFYDEAGLDDDTRWEIDARKDSPSTQIKFNIQSGNVSGHSLGEDLPFSDFWNGISVYVCGRQSRFDGFSGC